MTSLHVIFGLPLPQSKILATPMHGGGGGFLGRAPKSLLVPFKLEQTFVVIQEDQQTFAPKQVTANAFFL